MSGRTARIERATKESKVLVELDLDGSGRSRRLDRGRVLRPHAVVVRPPLAHRPGRADRRRRHVDGHHTVEDIAIALGDALREALGDKIGIRRFGDALVPLDEALVQCAVDVSGRPYCVHTGEPDAQAFVTIGGSGVGYLGLADTSRVRDARLSRADRAARPGAGRPRPAPPRGGSVQGGRPGAARRCRARPAGDGSAQHQGHLVTLAAPVGRRPRLRIGQRPLRGAGAGARRCRP